MTAQGDKEVIPVFVEEPSKLFENKMKRRWSHIRPFQSIGVSKKSRNMASKQATRRRSLGGFGEDAQEYSVAASDG